MALVLSWFVLGLGVIALAYPLAQTLRAPAPTSPRTTPNAGPFLVAALVLLVLGALLTLPTGAPWSPGQGLPLGFLLGGGSVLVSTLVARRAPDGQSAERHHWLMAAERVAAPVIAVGAVLVLTPRHVMDPLAGLALGAVTVGILFCGLEAQVGEGEDERSVAAAHSATTAVILAAATYLAAFHLAPNAERSWQPLPGLLTGVIALALTARGLLSGTSLPAPALTAITVGVPTLVVAAVAAFRLDGGRGFLISSAVGVVVFALISWLDSSSHSTQVADRRDAERENGVDPALVGGTLTGLLLLGGSIVAFRELHGLGLGVMTLSGLGLAIARPAGTGTGMGWGRAAFASGILLTLFRVLLEHRGLGENWEPDFHYYLVAFLLGAILPLFLAGSASALASSPAITPSRNHSPSPLWALVGVGLAGLAAALLPQLLWLAVGDRPQTALAVGLALCPLVMATRGSASPALQRLTPLLCFGALLSASQFTHLMGPVSEAINTRTERIGLLVVVAVLALAWVSVTLWRTRASLQPAAQTT